MSELSHRSTQSAHYSFNIDVSNTICNHGYIALFVTSSAFWAQVDKMKSIIFFEKRAAAEAVLKK
jgi:hypothetical protein